MNNLASPFETTFAPHAQTLPQFYRDQFLPEGSNPTKLTGIMSRVWFPSILQPLFWLMGKFNLLIPKKGENVPTDVIIRPTPGTGGFAEHEWERIVHFPKPVRFSSRMVYVPELGKPAERVGPGGKLQMAWNIRIAPDGQMNWQTARWDFLLGKRTLHIPAGLGRWLMGEVDFTQRLIEVDGIPASEIDLKISHPLFPVLFAYSGTFTIQKEYSNE